MVFIELPSVYATPGSVFIEAGTIYRDFVDPAHAVTDFSSLIGAPFVARPGAQISLSNESPFSMVVHDAVIRDTRHVTVLNGQYTVLQPGNIYVNNSALSDIQDADTKQISIYQERMDESSYDLGGLDPEVITQIFTLDQDLYLVGDVINESGNLNVENNSGSIYVSGEIRAEQVTISAMRDFALNSDDWYHTNQDPRQLIDYDYVRSLVFGTTGPDTY